MNEKTGPALAGELAALRDFFEYNTFVRKRYLRFIGNLTEGALKKDRGASYPSILDIVTHILDVDRSWLHISETGEDLATPRGLSLSEVRKLESEVDAYISDYMKRLRPEDLDRPFRFSAGQGKRVITKKIRDMLWHMVEEELQHRGELNALLWQDDIEPPLTDWFDWREELEKGRRRTKPRAGRPRTRTG